MNEKVEKEDVVQNEANEQETVTKKNEEGDIVEKKDETPEVEEKIDKPETSTRKLEIHIAFLSEKYEADIGKVISKFEGVKTCKVDVENKKVVITGDFDEEKLWKELEEKMRKRIVKMGKEKKDDEPITKDEENEIDRGVYMNPSSDDEKEMARWMMFSDENPNACSIS
ncbi:Heavy metal-associated domain HMA [Arabidopsis suecica]|uniref:Heavy metal-associated domain HMA n=1 Tax=Arabidopsis suecica TaxID=45249 RepID=A0A8T2EA56_ARASU|nr:Heavy metal-associated domain HMA [Arabidopsis suecica]